MKSHSIQQISTIPMIKYKYYCECCKYNTNRSSHWKRHLYTNKHFERIMNSHSKLLENVGITNMENYKKSSPDTLSSITHQTNDLSTSSEYYCGYSLQKSLKEGHQHSNLMERNIHTIQDPDIEYNSNETTSTEIEDTTSEYTDNTCICGKKYKHRQSLYKHRKICIVYKLNGNQLENNELTQCNIHNQSTKSTHINEELERRDKQINILLNELSEVRKVLIDVVAKNTELSSIPKTVNTQVNIMNYLNNECKNALNLSDFIQQIKLSFEDVLHIGDAGWISGMEKTFVRELRDMDHTRRPIHCSDKKRKLFYIKDENEWNKDEDQTMIQNAIRNFNTKQCKTYLEWKNTQNMDSDAIFENAMKIHSNVCEPCRDGGEKSKQKIVDYLTELQPGI